MLQNMLAWISKVIIKVRLQVA